MAIEKGKRIGCRWTKGKMNSIKSLGWEDLDESTALDRALEHAEDRKELKRTYNRFLSGDITLGELMRKLNQL